MRQKKNWGYFFIVICFLISLTFVLAATSDSTASTVSFVLNKSKLDLGTKCLRGLIGDCSNLPISEMAFSILAQLPTNTSSLCERNLNAKKISGEDCFGEGSCNVKDTALAIIALNSLGKETDKYEKWLLNNTAVSTDLVWIAQIDSDEAAECKAFYEGEEYKFKIRADKKIEGDAGECFSKTQSDYWLQVSENCYTVSFSISCDKPFKGSIVYKAENSNVWNILSDTKQLSLGGNFNFDLKAKCISTTLSCNYEDNLWAVLALDNGNKAVTDFMPYIIAASDTNKKYLPNSFIYMIRNFEEDANRLILEQKVAGNYWEADSTAYNKFYDTSLALLALEKAQTPQVNNAKGMMMFLQDTKTGCWNYDNTRDTAMLLWALKGWKKTGQIAPIEPGEPTPTTRCIESNFTCTLSSECVPSDRLTSYLCPGDSVCCKTIPSEKTCDAMNGKICTSAETCSSQEVPASDVDYCCMGTCDSKPAQETECEGTGTDYFCLESCNENLEQVNLGCNEQDICCKKKLVQPTSYAWLWITLLVILIILIVLGIIFRDHVKLWYFKVRSKLKKEDKRKPIPSAGPPGFAPRPGFPPIRRPLQQQMPPSLFRRPMPPTTFSQRPQAQQPKPSSPARQPTPGKTRAKKDKMDDVFKKLKDMSK